MRILIFTLALMVAATTVHAGSIVGQVTLLKKGGKHPLKSFANAVVYIDGIKTAAPSEAVVLNQKKKRFIPRLLPVVRGQEVQFLNSDRVRHNVFSPHEQEPFDLGRYPKNQYKSVRFNVVGPHKIYCNIHQRMIADILVLDNRYFAVTDKEGHFRTENVPPGEYTIKVWHIFGGAEEKKIRVTDKPLSLDFTLTSQKYLREIKRHTNKFGEPYARPTDRYDD